MKLGLVSAILGFLDFDSMIDKVSELGLTCVEVACWPKVKNARRYAGVQHIDVDRVKKDKAYMKHLLDYSKSKAVTISSLAFDCNPMDGDLNQRKFYINHLKKVIDAANLMKIDTVTTFIGRDKDITLEDNIILMKKLWPSIIKYAEKRRVNLAIENCPMIFTKDQWPGGLNIMHRPDTWKIVFDTLRSKNLGLNFDPSHFVWQMIDYIPLVEKFKDKIFRVHLKDIKLEKEKMKTCGVLAYPLEYMTPRIPGHGDVDWKGFFNALKKIKYDSYMYIEIEDKSVEGSHDDIYKAIKSTKRFIYKKFNF